MSATYVVKARHIYCGRKFTNITISVAGNIVHKIPYEIKTDTLETIARTTQTPITVRTVSRIPIEDDESESKEATHMFQIGFALSCFTNLLVLIAALLWKRRFLKKKMKGTNYISTLYQTHWASLCANSGS